MHNFSEQFLIQIIALLLIQKSSELNRVDHEHRRLLALEVDAHELLPSLLLEVGTGVRE